MSSDPYGLAFRVRDPPLLIGEVAYAYNQAARRQDQQDPNQEGNGSQTQQQVAGGPTRSGGLPGTVKLGAMILTGQYTEQLVGSLAGSPAVPAPALQHSGDVIAYGVIDQMLWRVPGGPGGRALSGFMRVSVAPDDRNAVSLYGDAGLTFRGLIEFMAERPGRSCRRLRPRLAAGGGALWRRRCNHRHADADSRL